MTFGWEYPPGVTGREPQIAGYPEIEKDVECHQPATVWTIKGDAVEQLNRVFKMLAVDSYDEVMMSLPLAKTSMLQALTEIESVWIDECPFSGTVVITIAGGMECWTCPLCRSEHEDDLMGDDDA